MYEQQDRVLIWFSCGAASAVSAKISVDKFKNTKDILIAYCDTGAEHDDNKRFLSDCENWIGHKIETFKSSSYDDIWDVFEKTKYLVGPRGARCTTEMKKKVRHKIERPMLDVQVFGFDCTESNRAVRFNEQNPDVVTYYPLIEKNISKDMCFQIIQSAGIELPMMYRLGYRNNNCIGCVKGQAGYWNKIRKDFPDVFDRMSKVERELNISINKRKIDGKWVKIFLDIMDPEMGKYDPIENISCGILCDYGVNDATD
jgi:3'-phosphoadenosine 5'-phosphosulfate sulfotransferase (PAPS reductase)/FAD synthetase